MRIPRAQTVDGSNNRVFGLQHCSLGVPTDPPELDPALLTYRCVTNGHLLQQHFGVNKRHSCACDELLQL